MNKLKLWWNKFLPILATGLFSTCLQSNAQQPPPSPPVKSIPPNTEWIVRLQPLEAGKEGKNLVPREIRGQRSQNLRHEVISWSEGQSERWLAGHFLLETPPRSNEVFPTPYSRNPEQIEKKLGGFPELEWIAPEHYRGLQEKNGRTCHYYSWTMIVKPEIDNDILRDVKAGITEMPKDIVYPHEAWIDAETRLPVAFKDAQQTYEYEFIPRTEPVRLTLPDKFLKAARQIQPNFNPNP